MFSQCMCCRCIRNSVIYWLVIIAIEQDTFLWQFVYFHACGSKFASGGGRLEMRHTVENAIQSLPMDWIFQNVHRWHEAWNEGHVTANDSSSIPFK
jgi:hypothetical protein